MVKIILMPANNGIIKKIIDDNYDGGNEKFSEINIYECSLADKNDYTYIKRFFYDTCEELGINLGGKYNKKTLKIKEEWGTHYKPTQEDIEFKIKELETEINLLKEWKK